jgi:Flp pilus assembly protein TadG
MTGLMKCRRFSRCFATDTQAASAVEFALVAVPLIFMLMGAIQIGLYYMVQSSLDTGVLKTADSLRRSFSTGTTPTLPTASVLKTTVVQNSGGLVRNDSSLAVEIRQISSLSSTIVPIVDGTVDYGSTTTTLAIRAQAKVIVFAPGFGSLANVRSSAILRRQGT